MSTRALLVLLGGLAVFAMLLANDVLTPVWLRASPIPGVKWLVAFAELATAAALISGLTAFGSTVALLLTIANLLALAMNFLAAMALGGVWFFYFYVLQLITAVVAWRAVRQYPVADRRYGVAAMVVGIWGATIIVIGIVAS